MMSKSLFFKLVFDDVRRNLWALALSVLGFLFALPILMVVFIQETIRSAEDYGVAWDKMVQDAASHFRSLLPSEFARLGLMIMALLCGVVLFRFLHDRRQVDFYHALPIRRECLYAVKFVTGLLLVLPAYFAALLAALAVSAGMGFGSCISWPALLRRVGIDLIAFLVVYGIALLCTVLCGNTLFTAALIFWAMFCGSVVQEIYWSFSAWFYPAFTSWSRNDSLMACPLVGFLKIGGDDSFYLRYLLLYVAAGAAALILSFVLFCRRKSECSGMAVAFVAFRLPLKVFTCITVGIGFGSLLMSVIGFGYLGMFWLLLFIAIGTAACHCAMEGIYSADFRAIFRSPVVLLAVTAASVLLAVGLRADVFGYSRWVPSESSLQWVQLNRILHEVPNMDASSREYAYAYSQDKQMTGQLVRQAAIRIAECGTQHLELCLTDAMTRSQVEEALSLREESGVFEVILSFGLSNGRVESRNYRIPATEENAALIEQITNSEEYVRLYSRLFSYLRAMEDEPDAERLIMLTDSWRDERLGILREEAQVDAFLEALEADELEYASDLGADGSAVVRADLGFRNEEHDVVYRYSVRIYPAYRRTLALMEEYMGYIPTPLRADEVEVIQVYDSRERVRSAEEENIGGMEASEEANSRRTTDPVLMERLLQDVVLEQRADRVLTNTRVQVSVTLTDGTRLVCVYPAYKVPEDALTELYGAPVDWEADRAKR